MFEYGDVSRYQPRKLTDKLLAKARTGLSAGNPADMVLMVKEIDRLRDLLSDYEDDFKSVMSEKCAPDEQHCTCVPHLRAALKGDDPFAESYNEFLRKKDETS